MPIKTIAMIGGTGFLGRHLAAEFVRRGYTLKLLTRRRERSKAVIVFPTLELVDADVHDDAVLAAQLSGCDAVVSAAGILNERRAGDFKAVHATLPERIVKACVKNHIHRLLHVSALGAANDAPSRYLQTKAAGERAIHAGIEAGLAVTCFRPSVIFGAGDSFINRFATLLAMTPVVFPLACANARFAPVFVDDVAAAMVNALTDKSTHGQTYSLCGPKQYTLSALVRYIGEVSGNERSIWELGNGLSRLQAIVMQYLPGKLFTMDNYRSMQVPSICDGNDLEKLGITRHSLESAVLEILGGHRKQARYDAFRTAAGRD
ncbi:MAG: NAD(P)H-binding protein [Gammaproteobacteria bacterium]|nr:NAD(P)H-binding protein [Gammaproteobacteria bacterium]